MSWANMQISTLILYSAFEIKKEGNIVVRKAAKGTAHQVAYTHI